MTHPPEDLGEQRHADRRSAVAQFLGISQTITAISALFLILARGFTRWTAGVLVLTGILTTISWTVFRGRSTSDHLDGQ